MSEESTEKTEEEQVKPWRFQKGVSGNPDGRPKGSRNFTTKVREALEKIADGESCTNEERFIKAILKKAIDDEDTGMMKAVWEQLDGKPLQRLANSDGSNLFPIPILDLKNNALQSNNSNKEDSKPVQED